MGLGRINSFQLMLPLAGSGLLTATGMFILMWWKLQYENRGRIWSTKLGQQL